MSDFTQVGYFGIGIWHSKHEVNHGTLLRSAHAFGAAFVFSVGRRFERQSSDTTSARRHVPYFEFASLDDLLAHLPFGCPLVGVELAGNSIGLPAFCHPERACYLLGAEDHGLTAKVLSRCHRVVAIPAASACLNVAVAGSIVLYDRVTRTAVRTPAADRASSDAKEQ